MSKAQATRLLDQIDRLGGDVKELGYVKHNGVWVVVGYGFPVSDAAPTEIKALAFELEDRLEDKGYERQRINGKHEWCDMQAECDGFAWVPFAEHTDRIEAVILAAEKMGGE